MKLPEIRHNNNDHFHGNELGHHSHHCVGDFTDYTKAVTEYKKTSSTKRDVLENTPDPAVK